MGAQNDFSSGLTPEQKSQKAGSNMSTLSLSWRDARFSSWIGCEFIELWRYTILAGDFFEDGSGKGTQRQGRFAARRRSTTASAGCW